MKEMTKKEIHECLSKIMSHNWTQRKEIVDALISKIPLASRVLADKAIEGINKAYKEGLDGEGLLKLIILANGLKQQILLFTNKDVTFPGSNGHIALALLVSSLEEITLYPFTFRKENPKEGQK